MLMLNTHVESCGPPSTVTGNKSGHSHAPPTAPAGPKSLRAVQYARSAELKRLTLCWLASTATITHFFVASCQKTLGSRNPARRRSITGLPGYFVHVRPRSLL